MWIPSAEGPSATFGTRRRRNKEDAVNAYYEYFQKAENFAKSVELRLFSKLDDPLFDMNPKDLSLKAINTDDSGYTDGMRVKLNAYICGRNAGSSGTITFTVAQYDEETGKVYTFPLYAGYSNATAAGMKVGNLYHIVGSLQKHNNSWQISGVNLDEWSKPKEDVTWTSQSAYYLIFDATNALYTQKLSYNCYGDVTVTEIVSSESGKLTFKGTALNTAEETEEFTFTVPTPAGYNGAISVGKTVSVNGSFQFEAKSGELTILSYSDITVK